MIHMKECYMHKLLPAFIAAMAFAYAGSSTLRCAARRTVLTGTRIHMLHLRSGNEFP